MGEVVGPLTVGGGGRYTFAATLRVCVDADR